MPGRDGTGPMGFGRMTGGGFGLCARAARAGRGFGRGFACRRGFGAGARSGEGSPWRNLEPGMAEPTKQALEEQVDYLESLLKAAKGNLERVSKEGKAQ